MNGALVTDNSLIRDVAIRAAVGGYKGDAVTPVVGNLVSLVLLDHGASVTGDLVTGNLVKGNWWSGMPLSEQQLGRPREMR